MARVGKIILAAGVIMTSVFLGFVSDPDVVVKTIGLGLAAAILIDALVVRMVVAPAVMTLLGDRAWTLPAWLAPTSPTDLARGRPPRRGTGGPRAQGHGSGPPRRERRSRLTAHAGARVEYPPDRAGAGAPARSGLRPSGQGPVRPGDVGRW